VTTSVESTIKFPYKRSLGPVIGAFMIVAMESYFAQFGQWVTVIQGFVFIVCVLAFRRGIVGEIVHRTGKPL